MASQASIWSPSSEQSIIAARQQQQQMELEDLTSSPFVQQYLEATKGAEERQAQMGELLDLQDRMKATKQRCIRVEIAGIEVQLEEVALEGKAAEKHLASLEQQTLAIRNADLQREQVFINSNRNLNNLRHSAPDRFATRRDIAAHERKIQEAQTLANNAEAEVRAHAMDLQFHLRNVDLAKGRVRDLVGKEQQLKSRFAYLRNEPAPGNSSGTHSGNSFGLSR
jgi:hypothetical protein